MERVLVLIFCKIAAYHIATDWNPTWRARWAWCIEQSHNSRTYQIPNPTTKYFNICIKCKTNYVISLWFTHIHQVHSQGICIMYYIVSTTKYFNICINCKTNYIIFSDSLIYIKYTCWELHIVYYTVKVYTSILADLVQVWVN